MPDLPTTPGSQVDDRDGHRYACAAFFGAVVRWLPLTRWTSRPLTTDQLLALGPLTVERVAPAWTDPRER